MKKLFVLFLLVALVPFTVGCSLWGNDEDNSVLDLSKVSVSVKVPASVVSSSLRGAVPSSSLVLTIGTFTFATGVATDNLDGTYTIVFTSANLTPAERASLTTTSHTAILTSNVSGAAVEMFRFPITLDDETGDLLTVTVNPTTGAISVKLNDGTSPTVVTGETYAMNITKVAVKGGLELTASATTAVDALSLTPTFSVTFDNDIATLTGVTWKVDVTHVNADGTTVKSYNLDSSVTADNALFTRTIGAADSVVDIAVVGTAAPKNLESGNIYKVKLTASNLKSIDGGILTTSAAEYFFKAP